MFERETLMLLLMEAALLGRGLVRLKKDRDADESAQIWDLEKELEDGALRNVINFSHLTKRLSFIRWLFNWALYSNIVDLFPLIQQLKSKSATVASSDFDLSRLSGSRIFRTSGLFIASRGVGLAYENIGFSTPPPRDDEIEISSHHFLFFYYISHSSQKK